MPTIPYPNVPNVPGVPQLLRKLPSAPPTIVSTVAGLASLARAFLSKSQWGIFKHTEPTKGEATRTSDGTLMLPAIIVTAKRLPSVTPDSYLDFDHNQEWSVTTAPTQQGAFADFNRVASPFEIKLRMTKGGTLSERKEFLQQIEDLGTTQLYDIFTPEKTYLNCNFTRSEISRRGEKGAYWLNMVDVFFREIRPVVATYTKTTIANPASPNASQQQNNGTQQGIASTATPPPSVTQ
jgi:hypothetical protein